MVEEKDTEDGRNRSSLRKRVVTPVGLAEGMGSFWTVKEAPNHSRNSREVSTR